jgi:hypothetical protein
LVLPLGFQFVEYKTAESMPEAVDVTKSLEELEGVGLGVADFDSSLVRRCHDLWRLPIKDLSDDDLRFLIGQQTCLPILMPMAVAVLRRDPLAEGDLYPGALLLSAMRVDRSFWEANAALSAEVQSISEQALIELKKDDKDLCDEIHSALKTMKSQFF